MAELAPPARALEWARTVPRSELDPALCEAHVANDVADDLKRVAGDGYPEGLNELRTLLPALGARIVPGSIGGGPPEHPRPRTGARRALGAATLVIGILVFIAPIVGIAGFLSGATVHFEGGARMRTEELDLGTQLGMAMIGFWVSTLVPVIVLMGWARADRPRDRFDRGMMVYVIVMAVIALAALHTRGIPVLDLADPVVLPVWTAAGAATAVLITLLAASRAGPVEDAALHPSRIVMTGTEDPDRIRQMVDRLPDDVRRRLADLRDAVVEALADRGLITAESAEALAGSPFGDTHWTTTGTATTP